MHFLGTPSMALPNTMGEKNYYLRNMVRETKSLKACHLAEAHDSRAWHIEFLYRRIPRQVHSGICYFTEAHIAQYTLQSLATNDTCTAQALVALYSKSPTQEPL